MIVQAAVLAAGGSRRFGSPKQLAELKGKTLLERAVSAAHRSACAGVTVVVGACRAEVEKVLEPFPVRTVFNPDWEEGIASSIQAAVSDSNAADPPIDAVLLMTSDQPLLTPAVLDLLLGTGSDLAACGYAGTIGVPALFGRRYFPELLDLQGDTGARAMLARYRDSVAVINWPEGAIDIDTPGDLDRMRESGRSSIID